MDARRVRGWLGQVETIPDWLAFGRLVLAPLLWIPAIRRKPGVVAAGVALSAASDVLDGGIARLQGERSDFGSQLDTVADMAIILSAPGWMRLLYPDAFRKRRGPLLALLAVAGVTLSIEWRRHGRLGDLHIHSTRAAAVAAHLWVINLFVRGHDSDLLFRLFLLLAAGGAAESLAVILTEPTLEGLSETPLFDRLTGRPSNRA